MTLSLSFTLGPVQGFVSASRRTRDLWGSSYLLSYLAGKAIVAVQDLNATISMPDVTQDPLLAAIRGHAQQAPSHGSLPNRFIAQVRDEEHGRRAGEAAREAIEQAWRQCAEVVWETYINPVARHGHGVRDIWDRQVAGFWEMSWVVGDSPGLLERRKNWRSHMPPPEPGDHCTVMGEWQELSGWIRSRKYSRNQPSEREKQDVFWQELTKKVGGLDLRANERLCAIAIIKRLLPRVAKRAIGWEMENINWPSTTYLGAASWMAQAWHIAREQAEAYAQLVREVGPSSSFGERHTRLLQLESAWTTDFCGLDGAFFHATDLENERLVEMEAGAREELLAALKNLYNEVGSAPHNFYSVLIMDGDSMGKMLDAASRHGDVNKVSRALTRFSQRVPEIVHESGGVTVYAGGDDVLALLPMDAPQQVDGKRRERAIHAATRLRTAYEACFQEEDLDGASISAGIVYAHAHTPLAEVLAEAHHALDDVAKARTGRDSVAICVMKSSGKQTQWSMPWEHALRPDGRLCIESLVEIFAGDDERGDFSSSFFYALRERYGLLSNGTHWEPGMVSELISGLSPEDILTADYLRAKKAQDREVSVDDARSIINALVYACRPAHRIVPEDGPARIEVSKTGFMFDAPLLVRFLSNPNAGDA